MFFDLRDRHGLTQVVARTGTDAADVASKLRSEFVVAVRGQVVARAKDAFNPKLPTGEVEIAATTLEILNDARTPPFSINEDAPVAEETRLRYRYLDLRRGGLQENLIVRHRVTLAARRYFDQHLRP